MDTKKQSSKKLNSPIPAAQLWIGSHQELMHGVTKYLQQQFCKKNPCLTCVSCVQISEQQHHAAMWFSPEKSYTREILAPLFQTISYTLNTHERFFFILEHADFLTPVCANSLLKPLEEPPAGYHFILLAEHQETLLPTVRSRCTIIKTAHQYAPSPHAELYALFTQTKTIDGADFLRLIDKEKVHERTCQELIDKVLIYWLEQYKTNPSTSICNHIRYLEQVLTQGVPPGGSKIILKDLYLRFCL